MYALYFLLFATDPVWAFPPPPVLRLEIGGIQNLKYSPDGHLLAVASPSAVVLLDTETLAQVGVLLEQDSVVGPIDFSPDGCLLALGVGDGAFSLWDVSSVEQLMRFGREFSLNPTWAVAFSSDGRLLAALSSSVLEIRDFDTGQIVFSQRTSRAGRGTVSLLSASDNRFLAVDQLRDDVEAGIIHPEGGSILWNVLTGKDLVQLKGDKRSFWYNFTISPDEKILAAASGKVIQLWDLQTGAKLRTLKADISDRYEWGSLTFSPNGKTLAVVISTIRPSSTLAIDSIWLWDVQTGELLKTLEGYTEGSGVAAIAFSPDGKTVTSGGQELKFWDVSTGREKATFSGHSYGVLGAAFRPGERLISASGGRQNTIIHWDLQTAKPLKIIKGKLDVRGEAVVGDLNVDGRLFAVSDSDSTDINIWDTQTGAWIQNLQGHTRRITAVAFSVDSRLLAASSVPEKIYESYNKEIVVFKEGPILIWDVQTGQVKHRFPKPPGGARHQSLAFSPNGKLFAAGSVGGRDTVGVLRWWDIGAGYPLQTVTNENVDALVFSPDGSLLATSGRDVSDYTIKIKLWDVHTGALRRSLIEEEGFIFSLAFHPNGKILASGTAEFRSTIRLWDVNTGAMLRTLPGAGHTNILTFSPDGQYLVVAGALSVWNLAEILPPAYLNGLLVDGPSLPDVPPSTVLLQNYPNPFDLHAPHCAPGTRIPFLLSEDATVTLTIYDLIGRSVRKFPLGDLAAGDYQLPARAVRWDGRNEVGEPVASGIYFYTLEAGDFRATRKMLLKK